MYSFINKYFKYPIGHPKVFVGEDCSDKNILTFEGLVKATILPPKQLRFPVLPLKLHNKLMFVLCRRCALELSQFTCSHTDTERALIATWVVDEIREGLKCGYTVLKVHEMWEYSVVQYNQDGRTFCQLYKQVS